MQSTIITIGDWQLSWASAGTMWIDGGAMYGVVPRTSWEKITPPDQYNRIPMTVNILCIKGHDRVFLTDIGPGDAPGQSVIDAYAWQVAAGGMDAVLELLGTKSEDVTDLLLTHLHMDHAAGLGTTAADGSIQPGFPKARIHVQKTHRDWAFSRSGRDRDGYLPEMIQQLENEQRLMIHDGQAEIAPGLELLPADGHTHGHQLILVKGNGASLLHGGDLLPTQAHLRPRWIPAYDLEPAVSLSGKEHWLKERCDSEGFIFLVHDPQVACVRAGYDSAGKRKFTPLENI